MNIWMVAREYAGIAEAGGVKQVACSLSEELCRQNNDVTLFIPFYGCTSLSSIANFSENKEKKITINFCGNKEEIYYSSGICNGVKIIFVQHKCFSEKQNVYTYTVKEQDVSKGFFCGNGYKDALFMDNIFQKAVVEYHKLYKVESPSIVHCHDACSSVLPALIKYNDDDFFKNTKCLVTIHNAGPGYHHEFSDIQQARYYTNLPEDFLRTSLNGSRVEPYLLAHHSNACLTTVSPFYAQEISDIKNQNTDGLSEIFSKQNIPIVGITNGIDIQRYTPEDKSISLLPFAFSPSTLQLEGKKKCLEYLLLAMDDEDISKDVIQNGFLENGGQVYIAFHARIVQQKGVIVLMDAIRIILKTIPYARFMVLGQGDTSLENQLVKMADEFPGKVVFFKGYDKALSRLVIASADFAIMPSSFEPCGLEDFIAQIFGTIPIAHATGGLKKIINNQTGYLYEPNTPEKLSELLIKVITNKKNKPESLLEMIEKASLYVKETYSWQIVVKKQYIPLYNRLITA